MAVDVNQLEPWRETRNTLAEDLQIVFEFLVTEPASDDPESGYQKAQRQIDRLLAEMRRHAVAGLNAIDDEVAAGDLVARIAELSREAMEEAVRLKEAVKTIERITEAVDKVAGVVGKIAQLPFL